MKPVEGLLILWEELRRKPILLGVLLALIAIGVWFIIPNQKRKVRETILRVETIFEARDAERLRPLLTEDFVSDQAGDRDETIAALAEVFENLVSLDIKIKQMGVEISGDRATALVYFRASGSFQGGGVYREVPFRGLSTTPNRPGELDRCRVGLVRSDGRWLLARAEILPPAQPGEESGL